MRILLLSLLIVGGLLLSAAGLWLGVAAPWMAEQRSREATALPLATVDELAALPEGIRVLVEGVIAEENPAREFQADRQAEPQALVIYDITRMEERSAPGEDPRRIEQVNEESVTPPFLLATPGGDIPIVNDDYNYQVSASYGGWSKEEQRLVNGFPRGVPALVDGVVARDGERPALRAAFVHPGPRDGYIAYLRGDPTSLGMMQGIGLLLGLPGVLLLFLGLWLVWR